MTCLWNRVGKIANSIFLGFAFCISTCQFAGAQTVDIVSTTSTYPLDICVDTQGIAYVVDRNLPGVWRWENGQLSEFYKASKKFRTPLNAPRCLALDTSGELLVGDTSTRDIYRVAPDGRAQPITGGKIGIPMDLAVNSKGDIYVADLELRQVVKIPAGTGEVQPVASVNPRGLFVDGRDQLWVVSQDAQQLQVISAGGQAEAVVANRVFDFPHQVVVNAAGEAFVSDGYKSAVWKVVKGSAPQVLMSGTPLKNPVGLALVGDRLVVVDPRAQQVLRLDDQQRWEVWFEFK